MARIFILQCKECNEKFEAKTHNKRLCKKCEEKYDYIEWWYKNTCSICGVMVKNRDQNGRGYECGCHDEAIKQWNKNIDHKKIIKNRKSSGNCVICNTYNENRDVFGRGINCGCSKSGYKRENSDKNNPGICIICGKENNKRDWNGRGLECKCSQNFYKQKLENDRKAGYCKVCGTYNEYRDEMGRGYECGCHENYYKILSGPGYCSRCGKWNEHRGLNSFGIDCGCSKIQTEKMRFNKQTREEFYNKKLNLIKFNYIDKNIKLQNIDMYENIPGVWALFNRNLCLQVGQNENIGKELKRQLRLIHKYEVENWVNDHQNAEYFHELGLIKLKGNLIIKIISENIYDLDERLKIEMQYAFNCKAKYWSPQPEQFKYMNMEEMKNEYIII